MLSSNKNHRSQEDLTLSNRKSPPNHPPPPPPPMIQVIKVDVSRSGQSEYDSSNKEIIDESVVSSFKPTVNAKLYASPEDMKTVGYRSKSLPSHSSRPNVRKSHSMRTNYTTFKPGHQSSPVMNNNNPYAQPIRASRSHSTVGTREKRRKSVSKAVGQVGTPPIPEPDYSCSESERESEEDSKEQTLMATRLAAVHLQPVENSGNSSTR